MALPSALHLAVWDENINQLESLLSAGVSAEALESLDKHGNTPLLLAYRMGRTRAARMLLAAGAFSKARTPEGWEAIHVAALTGNPDLVRSSVVAFLRETDDAFQRRLPRIQASLENMPDFTLEMKWEFTSWVPLLSGLLPNDTYRISKRGSSLRMDSTLLGMSGLKWERGNLSLLLWGKEFPVPGAVKVLDWDNKTECDARLALTHPKDQQIQDWVRKLLSTKQKSTDWWSRDTEMRPTVKKGMLGGMLSMLGGGKSSSSSSPKGAKGGGAVLDPEDLYPPHHQERSDQVKADVGGWGECVCYDLLNLKVTDVVRAPIMPKLKLEDWWKPEYSLEASLAEAQSLGEAAESSAATSAASEGSGGGGSGSGESEEEPEKKLGPLLAALRAVRAGKINASNAASATIEELEGMGFGDSAEGAGAFSGACVKAVAFQDYFGVPRREATQEEREAAKAAGETALAAAAAAAAVESGSESTEGSGSSGSSTSQVLGAGVYIHGDGKCHKPTGAVADHREGSLSTEAKKLDLKVFFAKNFPITAEQFLPVAEVLARTGSHAENFKRFFKSKMPVGAGFPVRFSIPVFPTITATITFELMETRRSVPKGHFEIPPDFKRGAYVEKGWIRQL